MTCGTIEEKLLLLTASGGMPEFSAGEREHLRTCSRCAGLAAAVADAAARIAAASEVRKPGPEYWASILPRVRERTERKDPFMSVPRFSGLARVFMPAAAAVVLGVLLTVTVVEPPAPAGGGEILSTLSAAELYDLRQAGKYTGLLEPAESNGGTEVAVGDLLADLLSEEGDEALYAITDPVELLREVDDQQFTAIVGMLEQR